MTLMLNDSAELSTEATSTSEPALPAVLVIDDHELLSDTLVFALRANGFDAQRCPVGEPGTVLQQLANYQPGLVLLDLDLGRGQNGERLDGVDLVGPLRAHGWSVLVVTGSTDLDRIAAAVAGGAAGWVFKSAPFDRLVHIAGEVAKGHTLLASADRAALIARYREHRAERQAAQVRLQRLSSREWEVLDRLTAGWQAAVIAEEFVTSLATVRAQIRSILAKLEVGSQLAAVALAHQHGPERPTVHPVRAHR
ncbi:MAG: response regulator [Sciscionella sp.]